MTALHPQLCIRRTYGRVAAIRLGRRFVGWEMNLAYVEIARKRIACAREQLELGL